MFLLSEAQKKLMKKINFRGMEKWCESEGK
jgi:hypothetical protein